MKITVIGVRHIKGYMGVYNISKVRIGLVKTPPQYLYWFWIFSICFSFE